MAVKTYSLKSDGNKKLSNNFTVREFRCKDGSDTILISEELVTVLQKIRDHFGKPVTINSAYRNATYNKKIGGASNSQHIYGTAADVVVSGVAPSEVAKYAEYLMPKSGGIGEYDAVSGYFTHIDVRASRARWKQIKHKETSVSGFYGYKEPVKELTEVNDIVRELANRKIVTDKELWLKKLTDDKNAYWLARKAVNYIISL